MGRTHISTIEQDDKGQLALKGINTAKMKEGLPGSLDTIMYHRSESITNKNRAGDRMDPYCTPRLRAKDGDICCHRL